MLLSLTLALFAGCEEEDLSSESSLYPADPVLANETALSLYAAGSYRQARDILLEYAELSVLDHYLLGRCYFGLEEYDSAEEAFSALSPEAFLTNDVPDFLLENFCLYYAESLFESGEVHTNGALILSNLLSYLDEESLFYDDVLDYSVYYHLRDGNYTALTNQSTSTFYSRLGAYLLGSGEYLAYLLANYDDCLYPAIFTNVLTMAEPAELSTWASLNDAIDIAEDYDLHDLAEIYLQRHLESQNDEDYYTRNLAIIEYSRGNKSDAVDLLEEFVESGGASMKTVTKLYTYQKALSRYSDAAKTIEQAMEDYPGYFYNAYITICDKQNDMDGLWDWYTDHDDSLYFIENYAEEALRTFIEEEPDYAEKLVENYLDVEDDRYMRMVAALFDYENGNYSEAYPLFLEIVLENPFTYEWIVSLRYEKELRDSYRSTYESEVAEMIDGLSSLSTKKQYYYFLALSEIDEDLFESEIGRADFSNTAKTYHDTVLSYFDVPAEIPEIVALTNTNDFLWNLELYEYVEALIDENSSTTARKAAYTYHYKDLYFALQMEGTVVHRLNSRLFSVVGDRRYHMLLPEEMQKTMFPLVEFEYILTNMYTNTNNAMWVQSSFREESHFRKHVKSWVGAVGFAQVMPYTAESLRDNLGQSYLSEYDFYDNVKLGCVLFRYLFDRYDDNYIFAMGAYNAGEGAINRWKKNCDYTTELWIEAMAYDETRNYVKRIMRTRYYYEMIYGKVGDFPYAEFGED